MPIHVDLHIHSKYSRATSRDCDLEHLSLWARRKGIAVVATGDLTHPAWRAELRDKLIPAEPGLFRLADATTEAIDRDLPAACRSSVRFMLTGEISTIYKAGERTRKVHHVVYAPSLEAADRLSEKLARVGNIASDGRPILGLDSRHLLEMVLESDPAAYLVPAHIWTPWFSVLGSKSGFDTVDECYRDLAHHIFAVETGLSSDPAMNWTVSMLDRFRLVSNSDAHSPANLAREATVLDVEPDYFAIRRALETGIGYVGTVEFFPEEGKYHLDGHRKCDIRLTPEETRALGGRCPVCGGALTVGVMHRVAELADRPVDAPPPATAGAVRSLVPLAEILSELLDSGPATKTVRAAFDALLAGLGPELHILEAAPLEDVAKAASPLLAEALARLRRGQTRRQAGYDGEYGVIRLFEDDELRELRNGALLFDSPMVRRPGRSKAVAAVVPPPVAPASAVEPLPVGLDPDQEAAAATLEGPLLIIAGPGSGKTRTLTHRIARLIEVHHVPPERCLAVTFTRRAATELRERLEALLPSRGQRVEVHTFHSLGLEILRVHGAVVGLEPGFRVADEAERIALLTRRLAMPDAKARKVIREVSRFKRSGTASGSDEMARARNVYLETMIEHDLVDFDDLVSLAVDVLVAAPAVARAWRERFPWISVDEYQDVDAKQHALLRLLAPPGSNLCAIGDPDQAIYGFRGADVGIFHRFSEDYPGARVVRLRRNYRSAAAIVEGSARVMGREADEAVGRSGTEFALQLHEAASERAEASFVVETLEHLLGGHSFLALDSGRSAGQESSLGFSDFAVLYRVDAQSGTLLEALARAGIPVQKRSHDPLALAPGVRSVMEHLGDLKAGGAGSVTDQLREAATASGDPAALAALDLLLPLARSCDEQPERFLSELALATEADTWDPRADRVSLMTLHASKGLEFQVVFVIGCEDGLLPLRWGSSPAPEPADTEEERRLFYVGMTRARDQVLLTRARRRSWRGEVREMAPSPFLAALPGHLVEHRRGRGRKRQPKPRQLDLF